jgi:hypothetical protein
MNARLKFVAITAAAVAFIIWLLRRNSPLLARVKSWVKTRPARQEFIDIETVDATESNRLRAATGLELEGYVRVIDSDAARKIIHDHGGDAHPVTAQDIARAHEHIRAAQKIRLSPKGTRQGLEAIEYYHKEGRTTVVVEEVRRGRRKLAIKTMYKQ